MNNTKKDRRKFFANGLKVLGVTGLGGFSYSAIKFMSTKDTDKSPYISGRAGQTSENTGAGGTSTTKTEEITSLKISAASIQKGDARILAIGYVPVIVLHSASGFKAFNAVCTHLGCIVKWDKEQNRFICPCHAGQYDSDGKVISGPPPLPLKKCTVTEADGQLNVSIT